jgi:DNA repair protein RecO (recombination protein O)
LDLLTEAQLQERFRGRTGDLAALYAGYYVAELLSELTEDYDAHPELFDEAVRALELLSGETSIPLVVLHFELATLAEVGFLPTLERCVDCQRAVRSLGSCFFSISAGGVVCSTCRSGKPNAIAVGNDALRILQLLADRRGQAWQRLHVAARTLGEVRSLVSACVCHLMGRKPRMLSYLTSSAR